MRFRMLLFTYTFIFMWIQRITLTLIQGSVFYIQNDIIPPPPTLFKAAPAASSRQAKKKSLVLVSNMTLRAV